jgi:hypothetical protein
MPAAGVGRPLRRPASASPAPAESPAKTISLLGTPSANYAQYTATAWSTAAGSQRGDTAQGVRGPGVNIATAVEVDRGPAAPADVKIQAVDDADLTEMTEHFSDTLKPAQASYARISRSASVVGAIVGVSTAPPAASARETARARDWGSSGHAAVDRHQ